MSNFSNEDVVKSLGNLTVMELISLTKELEAKWDVKALPQAVEVLVQEVQKVEQTEFTVILLPVSAASKMNTIKLIRDIMATGLKEAKEFVESAPKAIKEGISKEEASIIVGRLNDCGATCETK